MTERTDNKARIAARQTREAGEQSTDPYEDVDVSELPEWWRSAIEEHREYDLRAYQPPRFEDDTLKYGVVADLEREHDVEITFIGQNVNFEDDWTIRVDGQEVSDIGRRRDAAGYTVFEADSDEFVELITSYLDDKR